MGWTPDPWLSVLLTLREAMALRDQEHLARHFALGSRWRDEEWVRADELDSDVRELTEYDAEQLRGWVETAWGRINGCTSDLVTEAAAHHPDFVVWAERMRQIGSGEAND